MPATKLPLALAFEFPEDGAREMKEHLAKEHKQEVKCFLASTDGDGVFIFYVGEKPVAETVRTLVAQYMSLPEDVVHLDKDLIEV